MNDVENIKQNIIKSAIKLPLTIDCEQALDEVSNIPKSLWNEFRSDIHTDVESVFLKGYAPIENKKIDNEREAINYTPYLKSIIYDHLPGTPGKALVANLQPNGIIPMHWDGYLPPHTPKNPGWHYFRETLRLHIPLKTNPDVYFYCNNGFYQMETGSYWAINNLSDHGVINQNSIQNRIHLIVDIYPDKQTIDLIHTAKQSKAIQNGSLLQEILESPGIPPESQFYRENSDQN